MSIRERIRAFLDHDERAEVERRRREALIELDIAHADERPPGECGHVASIRAWRNSEGERP